MSTLFSPIDMGGMTLKNRLVCSATYEAMADNDGRVTDRLIRRYADLARGGVGLLVTGHMFVHPHGRAMGPQTGIHSDDMLNGLGRLAEGVHTEGGKIVFQISHGGRQSPKKLTGCAPLAPSSKGLDPVSLNRARRMGEGDIRDAITAFARAAGRARNAGADGVQLHAAHGFLVNEFLSPFYNDRSDDWGGSAVGRFRFLKEVVSVVKDAAGGDLALLVKLNTRDFTPKAGIEPDLAALYAGWLAELGIDALEVSCGTYYTFHVIRGDLPVDDLARGLPAWMRPVAKIKFKGFRRTCSFEEGYNLEAARRIKPHLGGVPLILVGGMRRLAQMEAVLSEEAAELVSLSRPFVREPSLARKFEEGKSEQAACISCNKCFAAVFNNLPLACYRNGLPNRRSV